MLSEAMKRSVARLFLCVAMMLLEGCGFPSDEENKRAFLDLAKSRIPQEISLEVVSTFRGDGDDSSFSQVVVFDAVSQRDVIVQEGWLAGIEFKKAVPKRQGHIELIYRRSNDDRWIVVDDGLTVPPS